MLGFVFIFFQFALTWCNDKKISIGLLKKKPENENKNINKNVIVSP